VRVFSAWEPKGILGFLRSLSLVISAHLCQLCRFRVARAQGIRKFAEKKSRSSVIDVAASGLNSIAPAIGI
jgi:hypothetical protein